MADLDTSRKPARKGRAKRGGLTRAQRSLALRRSGDYGTVRLIPGGTPITCRKSDGRIHLGEIEQAGFEFAGTGKRKTLRQWLKLKATQELLADIAQSEGLVPTGQIPPVGSALSEGLADDPTVGILQVGSEWLARQNCRSNLPDAEGLAAGIPAANLADLLIDRGDGREPWGHHELAAEFAGWVSVPLRRRINALWMGTVNGGPRRVRRTPEQKALQAQRGVAHRTLTDVLQMKGVKGSEYQRLMGQIVYEMTGHKPMHWKKELGEDWLSKATPDFQRAIVLVRQTLAGHFRRLDLAAKGKGKVRHFNQEAREVMPELLDLLDFWGLPRSPLQSAPAQLEARP
jgi:hypothetical protein